MKEQIRLFNQKYYEFDRINIFGHVLTITFDSSVDVEELISDMSVFYIIELLTRGNEVCGEFKNFTTVYSINGQTICLSDDGSKHTPPKKDNDDIIIIEIPEVIELTLEEIRTDKIKEFSFLCRQKIEEGIDIEINGSIQHFSYKENEDQNGIKEAFDLAVATGMSVPLHSDGGNCTLYTPEEMTKIYVAEKTNLTHHKTYFNQMKQYIMTLETKEEIGGLTYGDPLTGEYLETYQVMMNQAQKLVQVVISGGDKS